MEDDRLNKFNISDFKAAIDNYHRTSHFAMVILPPLGLVGTLVGLPQPLDNGQNFRERINVRQLLNEMMFHVESTEIPGISLATDEIRRYGIGNFERKPYVPTFKELDVVIRSDGGGDNYSFFNTWIKYIINFDVRNNRNISRGVSVATGINGSDPYEVQYKANYVTSGRINAYNGNGDQAISVTLTEMYPIYISPISLNWGDNNIAKFQVKFTFTDWHLEENYNTVQDTNLGR